MNISHQFSTMEQMNEFFARQNVLFQSLVDRMATMQTAAAPAQPVPQPPPLSLDGDMEENYDFFERNWNTYANALGMNQWPEAENSKKVSYLLSVIGFDALKKYFNFQLTDVQRASPEAALAAIRAKVVPARNVNLDS